MRPSSLCLVTSVLIQLVAAAQDRPLPDAASFLAATRENLTRAQREQRFYAYKERRTELHTNPFGRIGTGGTSTYQVRPGSEPGVRFRRLLARDGKPVEDAEEERQERRPRQRERSPVDDVVATLEFTLDRREVIGGRQAIAVTFTPKKDADPETREGRMARSFKGTIWVDEAEHEVFRVEATAIDDLSYGFGIIARLNEGTVVTLERKQVDDAIWLPTEIRFTGEGRALLFRKLRIDHHIEWFDYERVIPDRAGDSR